MGRALVTDVGAVAIGAGPVITAVPAGVGSTFSVRNFPFTSTAGLIDIWSKGAAANMIRVRSPKFADNVQGIRINAGAGLNGFMLNRSTPQFLIPQDSLVVEENGTAAAVVASALQSYYDDLSGASPKLVMPSDVMSSMEWQDSWVVAVTSSATPGNINSTPITTTYDVSQANRWYAVLGYVTDTALLACGITGADLSNLNIMGPGDPAPFRTSSYFVDLSMELGKPCIPCFNTANKGNTGIVVADNGVSTTANITLIVGIMPDSWNPPS
jgi:hypothetical protein